MNPDLERIAQLGDLDTQIAKILRIIARAERSIEEHGDTVANAAGRLSTLREHLTAIRTEEQEANRRIAQLTRRRTAAERVLAGGGGDAEAAQRQFEQCEALLDDAETGMLELLERQDALRDQITAASETLATAEESHRENTADAQAEITRQRESESAAREAHAAVAASLPNELCELYHTLIRRRKTAVSRIEGGACSSCHKVVASQQQADLRRGLIEPCRGCGRFLVF